MDERKEDQFDLESMFSTLMNTMPNLWSGTPSPWFDAKSTAQPDEKEKMGAGNSAQLSAAALKNWQALAAVMAKPESLAAFFKTTGTIPDFLLQLGQTSMNSFIELQQKMLERAGRLGESVEDYRFKELDENLLHVWTEIYEREFRKFFHVPQLGLTREYQERANDLADKYTLFQANYADFMRLLALPITRSMRALQEKAGTMAETGELPEDSQAYYKLWIEILEGHYMTLFQTPEYVRALSNIISSLTDFSTSRDAVFEDLMRSWPIAKQSDMEDLTREVYELKKCIRKLEKKLN